MRKQELFLSVCPICGESNSGKFKIYFDGYIKLYKCLSCTHVAQFSGPGIAMVTTEYDDYYDLDFVKKGQEFEYPKRETVFMDIANRAQKVAKGKKILDVGCGDGHFLHCCEKLGFETVGVEPSKLLSEYASKKINGRVINGYYTQNLFPERSFDVITFIQVIEHLQNPVEILKIAYYNLKPGGVLIIEVPSRLSPHFLAYRATRIKWFVKPPDGIIDCHVSYFSPKTMRRLCELAGFSEQQLITGRWKVKYRGFLKNIAAITDPIMNLFGVGGILYIGKK